MHRWSKSEGKKVTHNYYQTHFLPIEAKQMRDLKDCVSVLNCVSHSVYAYVNIRLMAARNPKMPSAVVFA